MTKELSWKQAVEIIEEKVVREPRITCPMCRITTIGPRPADHGTVLAAWNRILRG